jgi:hypothetical protein
MEILQVQLVNAVKISRMSSAGNIDDGTIQMFGIL